MPFKLLVVLPCHRRRGSKYHSCRNNYQFNSKTILLETVTVPFVKLIRTNIFTVTANKSGDYCLGNGNGNFQLIISENTLSGNGNGNFQISKTKSLFWSVTFFANKGKSQA